MSRTVPDRAYLLGPHSIFEETNMTSASEFNRRLRDAQRRAEQQMRGEMQRVQREVDAHNRRLDAANQKGDRRPQPEG